MKDNERRKKPTLAITPKRLLPDISIFLLRLVFQSFNVHLSLLCKKRPEYKANGTKQGEFINNVSKYRKIVGELFKAK